MPRWVRHFTTGFSVTILPRNGARSCRKSELGLQEHQLFGTRVWRWPEQHALDYGEDGGGGSNLHGEREHSHDGKSGILQFFRLRRPWKFHLNQLKRLLVDPGFFGK